MQRAIVTAQIFSSHTMIIENIRIATKVLHPPEDEFNRSTIEEK
jgi:hypothetical protein